MTHASNYLAYTHTCWVITAITRGIFPFFQHLAAQTGKVVSHITIGGCGRFPAETELDVVLLEGNG